MAWDLGAHEYVSLAVTVSQSDAVTATDNASAAATLVRVTASSSDSATVTDSADAAIAAAFEVIAAVAAEFGEVIRFQSSNW